MEAWDASLHIIITQVLDGVFFFIFFKINYFKYRNIKKMHLTPFLNNQIKIFLFIKHKYIDFNDFFFPSSDILKQRIFLTIQTIIKPHSNWCHVGFIYLFCHLNLNYKESQSQKSINTFCINFNCQNYQCFFISDEYIATLPFNKSPFCKFFYFTNFLQETKNIFRIF